MSNEPVYSVPLTLSEIKLIQAAFYHNPTDTSIWCEEAGLPEDVETYVGRTMGEVAFAIESKTKKPLRTSGRKY